MYTPTLTQIAAMFVLLALAVAFLAMRGCVRSTKQMLYAVALVAAVYGAWLWSKAVGTRETGVTVGGTRPPGTPPSGAPQ